MAKTYTSMSTDELEDELNSLSREKDAIVAKMNEIKAVRDGKVADEQAEAALAGLTPGQIDAVARAAAVRVKSNGQEAGA